MLDWKGDLVKSDVERAARLAVDATMSAAIIHARTDHGPGAHGKQRFESHSGELERGTKIVRKARRDARGVVGTWGVQGVVYARRIELGFQGKDRAGRTVDAPPFPYLRPAAEHEYPNLKKRMRRALDRTGRSKWEGPPRA